MADEAELFCISASKTVVLARLLVSVNDLLRGLSSSVFRVEQITQNPLVAIPCGFESHHRHQKEKDAIWRLFLFGAEGSEKPVQRVSLCPNKTRKETLTVSFHTILPSDGDSLSYAMGRLFLFGAMGSRRPVQWVSLCPNWMRKGKSRRSPFHAFSSLLGAQVRAENAGFFLPS